MSSQPAVTREELQTLASGAVFARDYDFRVRALGAGECTVDVPFQLGLERPGGLIGGPPSWLPPTSRCGWRS